MRLVHALLDGKIPAASCHLYLFPPPNRAPASPGALSAGQVVTVEPGLYDPGLGGVRLEDAAAVTAQGARNLAKLEKVPEAREPRWKWIPPNTGQNRP